ncbi:Transcription factor GTE7-like protein [Gossypium australe]|uniref:Transcription factor GTE7-like protein n=1 Tax=Gossypium australe TaxID=47621 RepID=A0A5B6X442_9ROSI|nr:Transcription factor GTE7-like protein [Gossypium australe]
MASAVLANRSDSNWPPQPKGSVAKFMGKVPFTATKPNPNPKFNKKRQFHHHLAPPDDVAGHVVDDSPAVTQSAASDDASSINRKLNDFSSGAYVSFRISSYSRKELIDLKNQLVAELEQIRELRNRIESNDFHVRSSSNKKSLPKKNISGNKRPLPSNFSKEFKRLNPQENGKASTAHLMKSCSQILTKLMKNKHGYIFNSPVDVVGMGLHDYYDIIKNPMDLGTVKSRMSKNFYGSPLEFAADVRLTFNNAMLYNPKGHEVYVLAEQFLAKFEELFRPLSLKLEEQDEPPERGYYEEELQASSWDHGEADRLKKDRERDSERIIVDRDDSANFVSRSDRIDRIGGVSGFVSNPNAPPPQMHLQAQARVPSPVRPPPVKSLKQPKPKAKDPNKREMSMEEKQKLGIGLQSLPQEKMDNVVQIIRKRNGHLRQDGDEIELDIEAMDTETLWELDRFVTNYKKMVSKIKRQALMANNAVSNDSHREEATVEKIDVPMEMKKPKKGDAGEEDVDIGDEMPMSSFPPVEIEKDNDRASSSSSSSRKKSMKMEKGRAALGRENGEFKGWVFSGKSGQSNSLPVVLFRQTNVLAAVYQVFLNYTHGDVSQEKKILGLDGKYQFVDPVRLKMPTVKQLREIPVGRKGGVTSSQIVPISMIPAHQLQ